MRLRNPTAVGWLVLVPVLALTVLGLIAIFACDYVQHDGDMEFFARQVIYALAGVAAMLATTAVPYQKLGRWSYPLFAVMLVLLGLLVADRWINLPLIPSIRGTRRWIRLPGFQVQPAELTKIAYILALAWYLRFRRTVRRLGGLVGPFVLTLVPMALILVEPDLGTVLLLLPVLMVMLFAAGARRQHLGVIVLLGLASMPAFYFSPLMKEYQRDRIRVLFRQGEDDRRWLANQGYQLYQSKVALGSGGLTGQPLLEGAYVRYDFLPDRHNDFIFSVVAHQWGFVGSLAVVLCFGLIVAAGIEIATLTNDPFGRLLVVGVVGLLSAQALINIGMTCGLMPITGMTLPFVSFGGSSLLTNFIAVGLLINVAQRRPVLIGHKPFEYHEPAGVGREAQAGAFR